MNTNKKAIFQILKFGLVGVSNTLLTYIVFYVCVTLRLHYLIANIIGFIAGVLNAYYWSNRYVFKVDSTTPRNHVKALIKTFMAYGITGIALQSILLYFMVEYISLDSRIAQLLCLMITVPLNFIMNKYWSFRD